MPEIDRSEAARQRGMPTVLTGDTEQMGFWAISLITDDLHFWQGPANLVMTIDGVETTFLSLGAIMEVQIGSDEQGGTSGSVASLVFANNPPELFEAFTNVGDPGPMPVTVRFLYSTDGGANYQIAPSEVHGRLSNPQLSIIDSVYRIEVVKASID